MLTNVLMGIFLLGYLCCSLIGVRYSGQKNTVFSEYDSRMIKGFFCIIVILVHVPMAYQNRIQDVIGSFAYIGVTYFFMCSGYGLKQGVNNKSNYLKGFWTKRIPKLLFPAFLCNLISCCLVFVAGGQVQFYQYINVHDWVKALLILYVLLWIVYTLDIGKKILSKDIVIVGCVLILSLIGYLTKYKVLFLWPVESLGFLYGVILADTEEYIKKYSKKLSIKYMVLSIFITVCLGLSYVKFKSIPFWGGYMLRVLLGASFIILILLMLQKFIIGNKFLNFMSKISYEFFLLQFGVYKFVDKAMNIQNSALYIFTVIAITFALSIATNWISGRAMNSLYANKMLRGK